jgi:hypothetical protein
MWEMWQKWLVLLQGSQFLYHQMALDRDTQILGALPLAFYSGGNEASSEKKP